MKLSLNDSNIFLLDGVIGNIEKSQLQGRLCQGAKIYTCNPFEDWLNNDTFIIEKGLQECIFPFVWLGNIKCDKKFSDFLCFLFEKNINVYWEGNNNNIKLYGPNGKSNNIKYYREASILSIPLINIKKEINEIEKLNLFEKLYKDNKTADSKGWYFWSLLTETYEWTEKAKKYCPHLLKYINSIIKNPLKRIMILKLLPFGYINLHTDNYLGYEKKLETLNLIINWPDNCELHFWTNKYEYCNKISIKPGKGYYFNVNSYHMVRNLSNETRYIIMIHDQTITEETQ